MIVLVLWFRYLLSDMIMLYGLTKIHISYLFLHCWQTSISNKLELHSSFIRSAQHTVHTTHWDMLPHNRITN